MKEPITEESGIHKAWYEEAKRMTVNELPEFLRKLTEDYGHDYGTVCHACAAAAVAAAHAINNSPIGGITGFQGGAVMWEFMRHWNHVEGPARLLDYNDLLYPQMEHKFRCISHDTWAEVRKRAQAHLDKKPDHVHPEVAKHWQSIAAGSVPFGLQIESR